MATSASAAADQLPALGPRRRGRPWKHADRLPGVEATAAAEDQLAALAPRRRGRPQKHAVAAGEAPGSLVSPPEAEAGGEFERERAARIRENMERMQMLGILDLAQTLAQSAARRWRRKPVEPGSAKVKPAAPAPLRRSLRLALTKHGRPRKHSALADQPAALGPRRRGRPRKHPAAVDQPAAIGLRKRGRPRKHAVAAEAPATGPVPPPEAEAGGKYERIRENMERMQ